MFFFTKIKWLSKLDYYFLVLSTALFFNIVTGGHYSNAMNGTSNRRICSTPKCQSAAQLIRSNIDETVDPCNNFFDFACGGFINKTELPPDKYEVSHRKNMQEKALDQLSKTLMEPIKPKDPRIFTLVKNYYKSCMNLSAIDKLGIMPLLRVIDDVGGWPILKGSRWDEKKFNWMKADSKLRAFGIPPTRILDVYVVINVYNTSINLLNIKPPELDIPFDILTRNLNDSVVQEYLKYMVNVAAAFGADRKTAKLQLVDIIELERNLYDAMQYGQSNGYPDINSNNQDVEELHRINKLGSSLKNIRLLEYLNGLTEPTVHLQGEELIVVRNPNYLRRVDAILPQFSKITLANYMIWKVIEESIPHLSMKIQEIRTDYLNSDNGTKIPVPSRKEQCTLFSTDKNVGITVGVSALYTRNYFSKVSRTNVKNIVRAIGKQIKNFLAKIPWLSNLAKKRIIRKLLYMKKIVGYPDELDNGALIDNYSRNLAIESGQYFQNVLNVRRFHYDDAIASLREPADKRFWIEFSIATTVNAYYSRYSNSFVLAAAILQYPIYDPKWPVYVKFGNLGKLIGHETMHAFGPESILYDETGSYNPIFSDTEMNEYWKRINCYVDQYDQYSYPSLNNLSVDGMLTMEENLADNVAMQVAMSAYKKFSKTHPNQPYLPGLKYTPAQLFWISTVNLLCAKQSDALLEYNLITNEHTPPKYRAIGVLSNMKEFADDFNCPRGSNMNPYCKCSLLI